MFNKTINILILILILIIIIYYDYTLSINNKRHLTDSYNYAHFSKINRFNYFMNPEYLFNTKYFYFELNEGESLYIPPKMWHWIITDTKSFSINFWFDKKTKSNIINNNNYKIKPIISLNDGIKIYKDFKKIISKNDKDIKDVNNVEIWNSGTDSNIKLSNYQDLINENIKINNSVFITLDGYGLDKNNQIKEKIIKTIKKPELISKITDSDSFYDVNIWHTSNFHDTGLHYDDYDGILHLIKGKKRIYLYPKEYTDFLSPYNIIPDYALTKPKFMNYNKFHVYKDEVPGKSSQFILYKTLEYFSVNKNINKIIQKIYDITKNRKILVWGFKKKDNVYRWEIYIYNFQLNNLNISDKKFIFIKEQVENLPINQTIFKEIFLNKNNVVNSFDILNSSNPYNNEFHTYEKKFSDPLTQRFYGAGFDIIGTDKKKVSDFIYDSQINFINNAEQFLKELGLPFNDKILKLLGKYNCYDLCVWNKMGDLFIQWLVISIDDFICFLQDNNYKEEFVSYIKNNSDDFKHISHEITIVYNADTLQPIRSGFYGCL